MPNPPADACETVFATQLDGVLRALSEGAADPVQCWRQHGVLAAAAAHPQWSAQAGVIGARARAALLAQELAHRTAMQHLGQALQAAGLQALVMKGEACATQLYPWPAVRTRQDIDLWVEPRQREAVEQVLCQLGGVARPAACGRWILPEQLWWLPLGAGHIGIDLHWQVCSRPALLPALPFADVCARARIAAGTDLPAALLPLALEDALVLACVHRRAHHREGERAIWLLDIALAWQQLEPSTRQAVLARVGAARVSCLLLDGLRAAARHGLQVDIDPTWAAQVEVAVEPARALLRSPARYADWRFDLRHSGGLQRWQVLRDYLLPSAAYMRQRDPQAWPRWLPWLYLRRLLRRA